MRTTLSIRDELYEAARQRAFHQRRTLGDVMNELIARGLEAGPPASERRLGAFAGQIEVADDFDDPMPWIEASFERSVDP